MSVILLSADFFITSPRQWAETLLLGTPDPTRWTSHGKTKYSVRYVKLSLEHRCGPEDWGNAARHGSAAPGLRRGRRDAVFRPRRRAAASDARRCLLPDQADRDAERLRPVRARRAPGHADRCREAPAGLPPTAPALPPSPPPPLNAPHTP